MTGGAGHDSFLAGDWIVGGPQARIMDFDPEEDRLVIAWDLAKSPDPDVEITPESDGSGLFRVVIDGVPVVRVAADGAPSVDDIVLMDSSVVRGVAAPSA
ncbi:hypothetical protein ACFOHS_17620 [Jhaorihella thermophila]